MASEQDATAKLFESLRPTNINHRPASITHRTQGTHPAQPFNHQSYLSNVHLATGSPRSQQPAQVTQYGPSDSVPPSNGFRSPSQSVPTSTPGATTGTPTAGQSRPNNTANLLNLLTFSTPTPSVASNPQPDAPAQTSSSKPNHENEQVDPRTSSVHGRGISASDLVASFMGKPTKPATPPVQPQNPPPRSSSNHQDFLLKLLNQSTAEAVTPSCRNKSPLRVFGTNEYEKATPFEPENMPTSTSVTKKDPIFTYVNPFEQLAASSPRHRAKATPSKERLDRRASPSMGQHSSSQQPSIHSNLTPNNRSSSHGVPPDGRSRVESLMDIGAPTKDPETIAQALEDVAGRADKEAERALGDAEAQNAILSIKGDGVSEETLGAMQEDLRGAAAEVKEELDKDDNHEVLKETLSTPVAEAVMDVIDEAAQESGGDDWTSADERGRGDEESEPIVPVYRFPQKPFVSLELQQKSLPELDVRSSSIIEVTKFKKDFDQVDRTLAAASNDYIVYSSAKSGGFRMLRQEDGHRQLIYKGTGDRIFNVALSTARSGSPIHGTNAVVATGVSGTVYWIDICSDDDSAFEATALEKRGLIFPPLASQGDSTSTGQLKTRAKRSNRHPEFFAIGRGKSIQIVFPAHVRQTSMVGPNRVVDTERYFQERGLKINTGKASKDFCFSEDDTVIITINKAARLQLWDVQELIHGDNATASKLAPIEIRSPVLSYVTASPSDKTWPTSVMCVDKVRPYVKGTATRYVIVGMRQNHTLQLWDLLLGKAVQELNLPHVDDMDAMCSVCYHPSSGMIAVGHPTRNSIYFIHLSTPRYNLPTISQAKLIHRLANKDSSLPKPEATSIMGDLREISLARLGQLRSIDLLPSSGELLKRTEDPNESLLFELYVTHSRGVDCISVRKDDVGWTADGKALQLVEAQNEGMVSVKDLYDSRWATGSEVTPNGNSTPSAKATTTSHSKITSKDEDLSSPAKAMKARHAEKQDNVLSLASGETKLEPQAEATPAGEKLEKKKKKKTKAQEKAALREAESEVMKSNATPNSQISQVNADRELSSIKTPTSLPDRTSDKTSQKTTVETNGDQGPHGGISSAHLERERKKFEAAVSSEFNKGLKQGLDELHRRIDSDIKVQNKASEEKQRALLTVVSDTLTTNVQKSMNDMILECIHKEVIPAISNVTKKSVDESVPKVVMEQLQNTLPPLLRQTLLETMSESFKTSGFSDAVATQTNTNITSFIENDFTSTLHNTIVPQFQSFAASMTERSSSEIDQQLREHFHQAELKHRGDNIKMDQLTKLVRELSETVRTMATAQSDFQKEILKLQEKAAQERQVASIREASRQQQEASRSESRATERRMNQLSPAQAELDTIASLMQEQRYEEACILWLQSDRKQQLFDSFFVRFNAGFINQLAPLVVLSIAALITDIDFGNVSHLTERLTWLQAVLTAIDPRDPDIRGVAPQIFEVLVARLEHGYMGVAEKGDGREDILRRISGLARRVMDLKASLV